MRCLLLLSSTSHRRLLDPIKLAAHNSSCTASKIVSSSFCNDMKDTFWVEETSGKPFVCNKRKRRAGKRKLEFLGWGSKPLIEFLELIGQDTKEKHSQHAVASFVNKYIKENGLVSAEKKKKVLCDDILFALFGKKSMLRTKVYEMLEEHFAENHDDSDDELLDSSDDEDYREKSSVGLKSNPTGLMKKVPKIPKSCFAAIIPENIKLIYLKKSLIQELLKFPESFEFKVIGSFVRMKSDPNDIFQKNPFQLQQVTGVEKVSGAGNAGSEIHLKVANFFRDIPVGMLSDDNFSEEEVQDVQNRIKTGSLNRLIVNELQLKAQILHADITKHWIAKEIFLLHRRIDHASEKGWQRLKFDYIERRKTLQTPSEQQKLLNMVPEVIAEELEPEGTTAAASGEAEISEFSPKSILRESSDVSSMDASGSGEIIAPTQVYFGDSHALKLQNGCIDGIFPVNDPKGNEAAEFVDKETLIANVTYEMSNRERHDAHSGEKGPQTQKEPEKPPPTISVSYQDIYVGNEAAEFVDKETLIANVTYEVSNRERHDARSGEKGPQSQKEPEKPPPTISVSYQDIYVGNEAAEFVDKETLIGNVTYEVSNRERHDAHSGEKGPQAQKEPEKPPPTINVIDLSDDDSENEAPKNKSGLTGEIRNDSMWCYLDPQGKIRGPFSLYKLKQWNDLEYFHSGFIVWKNGQTVDDGVRLADVLRQNFPY